jgi:hypothetical protein
VKVHEISAITDGGDSITFPAEGLTEFEFMLPKSLPIGDYLVRVEQIALENASAFQGAKFYVREIFNLFVTFQYRFAFCRSLALRFKSLVVGKEILARWLGFLECTPALSLVFGSTSITLSLKTTHSQDRYVSH